MAAPGTGNAVRQLPADDAESLVVLVEDGRQELSSALSPGRTSSPHLRREGAEGEPGPEPPS